MVITRNEYAPFMPVRPATASDVPAVLPMVASICAMHEVMDSERYGMLPDVVARYASWLPVRAADPESVFLVAESDSGAVIGFLVGQVEGNIPIYRLERFGFMHDVWVEPAHRGRGVARELTREALASFARMGITQVRLETAAGNEAARRLFASCGFRTSTVEMLAQLGVGAAPITPREGR